MTLLASPEQRIYELSRRIDRRIAAFREMSESAEKIRFQASLASQNAVAAMTHQITSGAFSQFAPPFRSVPIRRPAANGTQQATIEQLAAYQRILTNLLALLQEADPAPARSRV